jgi:hypothetical protein
VKSVPGGHVHDSASQRPYEPLALFPEPLDVQLARRREAALRCPPLACGRRDPLKRPSSSDRWTSPRVLHVEEGSRHTAWLHGGRLKRLCEHANVPHLWDPETRTWKVSRKRLGDLIAYARHVEGRFVTTELIDR